MLGIIDAGGGMRDVYSAGIYDCFLDKDIKPDYCLGVSAGSANLLSFACGQRGRNLEFYTKYAPRSEYMSFSNLARTGSYIGLDYVFSELCNDDGENPIDYDAFVKNPMIYKAVATRARDGEAVYFTKDDISRNNYDIIKASCCIPVVCKPYKIGEEYYYDGGVAEPIPIRKALEDGCDKVIVVLSKPREEYALPFGKEFALKTFVKAYPEIPRLMKNIHERCAEILSFIEEKEKEGTVYVLESKELFGMSTLTREKYPVKQLYARGYADALALITKTSFLKSTE